MKKVYKKYKNHEQVVFAAIQTVFEGHSINSQSKLRSTQKKFNLPVPMGHDGKPLSNKLPIPRTMAEYRSGGTPWVVILDKKGTVIFNDFHIPFKDAVKLINNLIDE